ncbi:MAG: hypothetical protein HFG32_09190 [Eubacterium sp.]|nr:hypothetical protein [Eubacterium sp.]
MGQMKLVICTRQKEYGEKLLRFLSTQHNPYVEAELLTGDAEEMIGIIVEKTRMDQEVCVISDDPDVLRRIECQTIALVTEPEKEGTHEIFMYQRATDIYRQIIKLTGARIRDPANETGLSVPKVTCVFSPGESEEKTMFSLRTAMDRSERGSVLYISLCGFPVLFQENMEQPQPGGVEGISNLMLCNGLEEFEKKLRESVFLAGMVSVLAPAGHFRDLFDFSQEEMKRFIRHLKQQTLYEAVVIEMGQLFDFTFVLLSDADAVLMPKEPGILAERKRQVFCEYCKRESQEAVWERIKLVPVSVYRPVKWEEIRQILGAMEEERERERDGGKKSKREDKKTGSRTGTSRRGDG